MKTNVVFLFFMVTCFGVNAQYIDDFSDGDLSEWFGDTDLFTVEEGVLRLNDEDVATNQAYLATQAPTGTLAKTTWQIKVMLDFSPSGSNFALVYLAAQNGDLSTDPDGYYLKVGGISGNDDALEFYVRENGVDRLLIGGAIGAVASDPVMVNIRIERTTEGIWRLLADYQGGENFQLEGETADSTYPTANFFGVVCSYTSTRNDAFGFDDVFIDPLQADEEAPSLLEALAIDEQTISLLFSEPILASSVVPENFLIDNGIGTPLTATLSADDPAQVLLILNTPLISQQNYRVTVNNVQDIAGNIVADLSASFSFIKFDDAAFNDIIITEVFPDPNPSVGLPEFEFVELYNRSEKVIQLENFGFSSGGTPQLLPDFVLLPEEYVIVTDEEAIEQFESFGAVIGISSFPSLTNSGDELSLIDAGGNPVFNLSYSDEWYQDDTRDNGGYSLELINPEGPYDCAGNWRASIAEVGGTPGSVNSWQGLTPDQEGPLLLKAVPLSDFEVLLTLNEDIDPASVTLESFSINNGITILQASSVMGAAAEILLTIDQALTTGTVYEITVNTNITDCLGNNILSDIRLSFGIAEPMEPGDLIINEVLFNPESGGEDFVEAYNVSDKILNLNGLDIINDQKTSGNARQSIDTDFLLFPNAYAVITDRPDDIISRYNTAPITSFLSNDLPTLDARAGNVTLSFENTIIDAFDYSEDLHYALLEDEKGVSLERISFDAPTNDPGNWHTAAATVGFATPGLANSQFFPAESLVDEIIQIPEKTISPDGDGFQDVLLLRYETDQPGYVLNAKIFDVNGREIYDLLRNELLGNSGSFKWDGVTNEDSRARIGIYILWLELFDGDGNVTVDKETIVVAGRLE